MSKNADAKRRARRIQRRMMNPIDRSARAKMKKDRRLARLAAKAEREQQFQ